VCLEALNRSFTTSKTEKELKMLDTIERTETTNELPLDTAAKRALIESELRKDAGRSDREIARVVKCDHKTVGAARERLGLASPLGNFIPPTPTEHRRTLINAGKDFDAKFPLERSEETVDRMIADGKLNYAEAGGAGRAGDFVAARPDMTVQAAVDQCQGAIARMKSERQAEAAKIDESNGEQTMVRAQKEITIQFCDDTGEWVIKQKNWPDDDGEICINEEHIQDFLDALCDRLGIASIRGSDARA
jgi:hypothetical protein